MRTPNEQCALCQKPLYRRPFERETTRYFACMGCRSEAQKVFGVTEAQQRGLALGRPKGTNHRTGYKHKEESKRKASLSHIKWCAENPEKVAARGAKNRGEKSYNWKGGKTRLNTSIREMVETLKWSKAVKKRDRFRCVTCNSRIHLEAHHKIQFSKMLAYFNIKNRADARRWGHIIWNVNAGETLCRECHYAEHGRKRRDGPKRKRGRSHARASESFIRKTSE